MDQGPIVWDDRNRKHPGVDHPERAITLEEIEQALADPARQDVPDPSHGSFVVVGQTRSGRWLVIAWIRHADGRYPIHAREAGRRVKRRSQQP